MLQSQVKANWCSKYNPIMGILGPSISSPTRRLDSISGRIKGMTDRDKNSEFPHSPHSLATSAICLFCLMVTLGLRYDVVDSYKEVAMDIEKHILSWGNCKRVRKVLCLTPH